MVRRRRKVAKANIAKKPAAKSVFGDIEYWRKEITLAGFFMTAVGLVWFLSVNNALALPSTVMPLIIIMLGFVMALAGVRER